MKGENESMRTTPTAQLTQASPVFYACLSSTHFNQWNNSNDRQQEMLPAVTIMTIARPSNSEERSGKRDWRERKEKENVT